MGGYERKPYPWALDGVPEGFEARLLPEDWERMEEVHANGIERVPDHGDAAGEEVLQRAGGIHA